MFATINQMLFMSRWRLDRVLSLYFVAQQQSTYVRIPAAVLGLAALMALTAALWSPLADATGDCRTSPLVFKPGATIDTSMSVGQDRACSLYVSSGSAIISSLAVVTAPSDGAISPRGRTGVIYRSLAGNSGEDAFTIALAGKVREDVTTMTIKVRVHVR